MIDHPNHGKKITTVSYYEGEVASQNEQLEVSLFSSKETLLKDVIDALSLVTKNETTKLELCINVDTKQRIRIVKTWRI